MVRGPFPTAEPRIVLLGGVAGAGKTTVAASLAKQLDVLLLQADAFWLALKAVTTPQQYPELHLFPELAGADDLTPGELCERFIAASEIVCNALEPAVRFQSHAGPGLVLEGAWLLPSFAAKLAGPEVTGTPVRSVFLFEADRDQLLASLCSHIEPGEVIGSLRRLAEMAWLHGLWLRDRCRHLGVPVIAARPRDTLLKRVREAIGVIDSTP